ncbi:MAG: glycosyltransferase family 4 protein [Actinomycetota bacterium]
MTRRTVVHLTTTDMSLDWLLRPQLEAFRDAGYDVVAMSAPGPLAAALEASGIRHHPIASLTRSMSPARDLRAVAELYQAFRTIRPTIVHTHNPKPGVFGRVAARAAGVPAIVNTVHGLYALPEDPWRKRALVYGLERLAAGCSHAELLQNPEDLPVLRRLGVPHERLTVLGNGVDLERFDPDRVPPSARGRLRADLGIDDDTVVIGVVGRLVWEKGYREIFEAAARLRDEPCVFVVVGPDDPAKAEAIDRASIEAAEADGVRFVGPRTDMTDLYSMFDVYALASYREGYPRSAMEAAAMGLPVVATDIRGCRQVVVDGENGALVPVRDAGRLTSALLRLVADPELRIRQGVAGRVRAIEHFDDRDVIATTLRTYDALLGPADVPEADPPALALVAAS